MPDHYLLQWSNHQSHIAAAFSSLRQNSKLVDVTLAADGRSVQAHKVVLCACSAYFEELLSVNPCKHPIVYLKDVQHEHLAAVVEFMYNGAVYVGNQHLDDVLSLGASLRVRGMVDVKGAASSRQGSNDENKDPETPAGKKRKRRPGLSRDNSTEEAVTSQPVVLARDPSMDPEPGAGPPPPPPPPLALGGSVEAAPAAMVAEPVGKPATVPTAAERKAAPPRSYSEGDMAMKVKEGLDGEDCSSPRAKRCLLQRQPRVKRECDHPPAAAASPGPGPAEEPPRVRSPSLVSQPSGGVETLVSDMPPGGGSYLAVPTGSYWPVRQMSTPTPVLSTREGTLVKQGSMPSLAVAPSAAAAAGSPGAGQKQRSTPVLSRGGSGPPAYFVVSGSSSTPLVPVVVSQSQPVPPQILLTSADETQPPSERSLGCRSHAPVLREGPAVSCSHCWNTEYSQGRTLRRKTKYMCRDCSVSLCIVPCFQEYHETVTRAPLVVSRDANKPTANKKILPKLGSL